MILSDNKETIRFLKFATVGAIGSVVDFGVMNLMTHLFDMPLTIAGTISFICAVLSNFTLNRFCTYPESRSRHFLHQLELIRIDSCGDLVLFSVLLQPSGRIQDPRIPIGR